MILQKEESFGEINKTCIDLQVYLKKFSICHQNFVDTAKLGIYNVKRSLFGGIFL